MTAEKLEKLIANLKGYAIAVGDDGGYTQTDVIAKQLDYFALTPEKFVPAFTKKGK